MYVTTTSCVVQDTCKVLLKHKATTKMQTLMESYIAKQGLQKNQVRFEYAGQQLRDTDTAAALNMKDSDVILVSRLSQVCSR